MADIDDRQSPTTATAPLPTFSTEEEARAYWAAHDSAPFFEQMEDVTDSPPPDLRVESGRTGSRARRRPAEGRMDLVSLRIPPEVIDQVKEIAAERHVPYQTLMRSWLVERLAHEQRQRPRDDASTR